MDLRGSWSQPLSGYRPRRPQRFCTCARKAAAHGASRRQLIAIRAVGTPSLATRLKAAVWRLAEDPSADEPIRVGGSLSGSPGCGGPCLMPSARSRRLMP